MSVSNDKLKDIHNSVEDGSVEEDQKGQELSIQEEPNLNRCFNGIERYRCIFMN